MFLGDLPLDIRYGIFEHCSTSDLAALSRVHSSVRDVAENFLYSHIRYCAQPLAPLGLNRSPLHTLATNSQKASMVKSFYIELENSWHHSFDDNEAHCVLVKLVEALEKMPNLVDSRILHRPMEDLSEGRVSQVIRFVGGSGDNHDS